ncbi:TIGR01777 family oxidoreductase [Halorhodospira halophila]|uniref:NAD-dependent epimerase/dehydratase n=1 Tax=Halorhodospira halophila (strain DSM 244 / SL1) TaxID=349124 RepID=A1WTG5_HALHL|nr:TIGR01777 family oxidoreductase [Halorhodospira halophila]ABM60977.1 NAD-dependent epimerase/dehydratase [Halorhodospira halophila SL1]MBK1728635.1 TIGR01777 family protein [Halorhodospira halophila]
MRILITGGSGFVGKPLCARLHERGHELLVVSRNPERARGALPPRTNVRPSVADFVDSQPEAIINLAGESIAEGRWTEAKKQRLLDSRLTITQALVDLCGQLETPPKVMVSASAMGYYGDQGDREVTEETPPNPEFVHELCARWEETARQAESHGVRVALMRIGLVLDRDGGTLAKLLTPFRLGLGGPLGSGKQYMPWIHRTDLVRIILFLLDQEALAGPFNAGAPEPVTNAEFTRTLARHLHRPAFLPAPAPALRLAFGEMSRILLTGARMRPQRLQEAGFTFEYPTLDEALSEILRKR